MLPIQPILISKEITFFISETHARNENESSIQVVIVTATYRVLLRKSDNG